MFTEMGSSRAVGMMFPGNGAPVSGSLTAALICEKSPRRIAADGTLKSESFWLRNWKPS